ncbi:hypothetical protein NECAME_08009 [Necator americanus]|uniref:Uncharacterized protein n=1 Tax=Necator americanus TaxID=51031 RepID=W2TL55_NECAM|nr:hypothetical protein NECAME_08009 [Necator americanus]ETN82359.1 hypothetical protein NECAME_08009 [Necator americanus]
MERPSIGAHGVRVEPKNILRVPSREVNILATQLVFNVLPYVEIEDQGSSVVHVTVGHIKEVKLVGLGNVKRFEEKR